MVFFLKKETKTYICKCRNKKCKYLKNAATFLGIIQLTQSNSLTQFLLLFNIASSSPAGSLKKKLDKEKLVCTHRGSNALTRNMTSRSQVTATVHENRTLEMLRLHRNVSFNTLCSVQKNMAILNNKLLLDKAKINIISQIQNEMMLLQTLPWKILSKYCFYSMVKSKC